MTVMKEGASILRVKMPGALMFQLPRPEGLPDVDTPRTRMVRQLGLFQGDPALGSLAKEERDALFLSLSLTLARVAYHRHRFDQVVQALNQRRELTAAFITYDMFSQYALFEAAAALGAVRLGVDEVIYIIARIRGVDPQEIHQRWKAEDVMRAGFAKRPEFNLPEVLALRNRSAWYDELNDYRNVLHHRGWRTQIGGYFPKGSDLPEASIAKHNVMLVPDRASLADRARPHDWTYTKLERLEAVVGRATEGFELLLDEVCITHWGGAHPSMGSVPQDQHPNVIVSLVRPALLIFGDHLVLPVFTSSANARAFRGFPDRLGLHLAELAAGTLVLDEPAFSFGLPGLKTLPYLPSAGSEFFLVVDPTELDPESLKMTVKDFFRMPLATLLNADETDPINITQASIGVERVYLWRQAAS